MPVVFGAAFNGLVFVFLGSGHVCPLRYEIDSDENMVRVEGTDRVTDKDLWELPARISRDPKLKTGMPSIMDLTGVTDQEITKRGIEDFLYSIRTNRHDRGEASAAIVATDDYLYGMARMIAMKSELNGPMNFSVFRARSDALSWLELECGKKSRQGSQNSNIPDDLTYRQAG